MSKLNDFAQAIYNNLESYPDLLKANGYKEPAEILKDIHQQRQDRRFYGFENVEYIIERIKVVIFRYNLNKVEICSFSKG